MGTYIAAFGLSLSAALIATPLVRRIAIRLGVHDMPTDRKVHSDPVPYLGGLAIVIAFSLTVLAGAFVMGIQGSYLKIAAIIGGGLLLSGVGLWDDLRVVPGWIKVPVELGLGVVLFAAGVRAELFGILALDLILTVAWVIGITNALNYMDNMDGLSSGVAAIASVYFAALASFSGQFLVASLAAALAGCAIGFLWYNRPPARIFMGDTGSLFLGFLLAALGLELSFDNIARVTFFVPIAIMAVPIVDALMVSVSRVRRGLSPIHPGRDHTSHRLVRLGVPSTAAVALIYATAAATGWIGVVIAFAEPTTAYMLMGWLILIGGFLGALLLRVDVS
ncbi:MAG: glycosyltransferase family 4 protein [Acidimicrobiia bacterium]